MEGANCSSNFMGFGDGVGLSPLMMMPLISSALPSKHHQSNNDNSFFLLSNLNSNPNSCNNYNTNNTSASTITTTTNNNNNNNNYLLVPFNEGDNNIKSRIMSHPHYPRLLAAYVNCHKIGAPPDVVAKLEEAVCNTSGISSGGVNLGEDPALDQFMEAYCEMLTKYEEEISKPFKEAMLFFSRMESQFKSLTLTTASPSSLLPPGGCGDTADKNVSSEDDAVDVDDNYIDPQAEDRELKGQLLRKYSGYLGSLKKEFLKKRKKGKLPKEARQQLLDWWSRHYKWPYPSESQKLALAETTGLDPKQINNWFINQRKRHWKPTDDMQYAVMDASHPTHYYMENNFGGANPFPHLDCGTTLF